MTAKPRTCSDHILAAIALLDILTTDEAARARDELEKALDVIQMARCEATTAIDRF